jgi:hypothetical protein
MLWGIKTEITEYIPIEPSAYTSNRQLCGYARPYVPQSANPPNFYDVQEPYLTDYVPTPFVKPTSYISVSSSTITTKAADIAYVNVTNDGFYNANNGTILSQYGQKTTGGYNNTILKLVDRGDTSSIQLYTRDTQPYFDIRTPVSNSILKTKLSPTYVTYDGGSTNLNKTVCSYVDSNKLFTSTNGVTAASLYNYFPIDAKVLSIGSSTDGAGNFTNFLNGYISSITYYDNYIEPLTVQRTLTL